jgi:pimeloyl-ACP methyl ester carboxylesterase
VLGIGRRKGWLPRLALACITAGALAIVGWWAAAPDKPGIFYDRPVDIAMPAGTLLSNEPYVFANLGDARAWRVLYRTNDSRGAAATASAVIVAGASVGAGPRPIIAWAHGTTGIARGCAPSVLGRPLDLMPAATAALRQGWVIVATDYIGLGTPGPHAYLDGRSAAQAVLDAVRAARSLPEIDATGAVTVWGHSQGGGAALWTGLTAPSYAPDVDLVGIAALAPASDLPTLMQASADTMFGRIVSAFLLRSQSDIDPATAAARYAEGTAAHLADDIASRCIAGKSALLSVAQSLALSGGVFARDPADGPLGDMLRRNVPLGDFPQPVLIAQGEADDLVRPEIQAGFVKALCARGVAVDARRYAGRGHVDLVQAGSPLEADLIGWTKDRIERKVAVPRCAL